MADASYPVLGTVIYSALREDFAVLAADRLFHAEGKPPIEAVKIVSHVTLPLAVAIAGFESLPMGERLVASRVKEILESVDAPSLVIDNLINDFLLELDEDAEKARADTNSHIPYKAKTSLFIAAYTRKGAELSTLILPKSTGEMARAGKGGISGPQHVLGTLSERYPAPQSYAFLGQDLEDRGSLVERVRAVMAEAIAIDEELLPEAMEVGGDVDIVMVDKDGAHWQ